MIINSKPDNEAIVSNVGQIGEFRIRNSAKAFNILSSGLYANKVRAIIRELSCNAVDSHTAAGRADVPFEVHLPNALEPWFSIKDKGTGLSHDQVTNIYTTYFESTKTESNDFIGALGLGSKSPFSYTDNFTVIAVKDGKRGIYTAFINEQGVPSIARMEEIDTDEEPGVEVRFSVEDRYDFRKFRDEASSVYKHFKLRPTVTGSVDFRFEDPSYEDKDIVPGVHSVKNLGYYGGQPSVAIMGNIEYPINIPEADKTLGDLKALLSCGLVMEFDIGELDFQASREGLSYIPETIESIRKKLALLNDQLVVRLTEDASKLENLWDRAEYLSAKVNNTLWAAAVTKYIANTGFALMDFNNRRYHNTKRFTFTPKELEQKYNISAKGFTYRRGDSCSRINMEQEYDSNAREYISRIGFQVASDTYFVVNDTKVGAQERAKYHWRTSKSSEYGHSLNIFVLDPAVKGTPINFEQFFKDLSSPPANQIFKASDLRQKERAAGMGRNVTIMNLERRGGDKWGTRDDMVWRAAAALDQFDAKKKYYYLPLSGFESLGLMPDVKAFSKYISETGLFRETVYGVRKADIKAVEAKRNWINLDKHIKKLLSNLTEEDALSLVKAAVNMKTIMQFKLTDKVADTSPFMVLYNTFKDVKVVDVSKQSGIEYLCKVYKVDPKTKININDLVAKYKSEVAAVNTRYPLLTPLCNGYNINSQAVADYINAIDVVMAQKATETAETAETTEENKA